MFENYRKFEYEFAGRPLVVEVGKMAQLANGSALVRYGDTAVLCCATASAKPREGIDFLPLSVDFEERMYAAGKIPGGYFRREGKPTEKAILTARVIDRPVRPLFPKDLRNDVALTLTVMSVDQDCSPEITAMVGASIALSISDIPWNGPIGGVFMGLVDGELVVNPTEAQRAVSDLELTVASSEKKVVMIEAGAREVDDETMYNAIMKAFDETQGLIKFINSIVAEVGKPKFDYPSGELDHDMFDKVFDFCEKDLMFAMDTDDKTVRDARVLPITDAIIEKFSEEYPDIEVIMPELMYKLQKKIVRRWLIEDHKRVDGRSIDQMRPLAAEVGMMPRVHGSGMFTRGQTQVITCATLGTMKEAQELDGIDNEATKRYMHHYNMPGYSVGEAKSTRSPGRREIGHGALAERALVPVLPSEKEFPYAIRLVSEVISSNGSTSQASICGSTLALMDAGVPIKDPVAGISCGLITKDDGSFMTMVDIQGVEDFYGDMDFKVAGTHKGITAIQMDLKIDGLTPEIIKEALTKTHIARDYIIDNVILKAIPAPRADVSEWAPKMLQMQIKVEKIREVIGKGGEVIQKICADTGAKIDIEEDGSIFIAAVNKDDAYAAKARIDAIVFEPVVGAIYTGVVTRIVKDKNDESKDIGVIVEYAPGKDTLVHISKLQHQRTEKCEDVCKVGDTVNVKYMGIDSKGREDFSMKDAMPAPERPERTDSPKYDNKPRNNDHNNNKKPSNKPADTAPKSAPAVKAEPAKEPVKEPEKETILVDKLGDAAEDENKDQPKKFRLFGRKDKDNK